LLFLLFTDYCLLITAFYSLFSVFRFLFSVKALEACFLFAVFTDY